MKKIHKILFLLALVFILIGMILIYQKRYTHCGRENITLTLTDGSTISGEVYIPKGFSKEKYPGVVLVHGYMMFHEFYETAFSLELAKRGFVVLAIDYNGHGDSTAKLPKRTIDFDKPVFGFKQPGIEKAIDYLIKRKDIDPTKIALVGHSMGGFAVTEAGYMNGNVVATVSIGATPQFTNKIKPKNFLLIIGGRDEMFDREMWIKAIKKATGNEIDREGILYGDFSAGNARELIVSPRKTHSGEVFDPLITTEVIKWLELTFFGNVQGTIKTDIILRLAGILISCLGLIIGFNVFCRWSEKKFLQHVEVNDPALKNGACIGRSLNLASIPVLKNGAFRAAVISENDIERSKGKSILIILLYISAWIFSAFLANYLHKPFYWIPLGSAQWVMGIFYSLGIILSFYYVVLRFLGFKFAPIQWSKVSFNKSLFFGLLMWLYFFIMVNLVLGRTLLDYFPTPHKWVLIALLFFLILIPIFINSLWLKAFLLGSMQLKGIYKTNILFIIIFHCLLFFILSIFYQNKIELILPGVIFAGVMINSVFIVRYFRLGYLSNSIIAFTIFHALTSAWIMGNHFPLQ